MPDIVSLSELKAYLGDAPASADDVVLTQLLDNVEALFESATLRAPGSYTAAATGRTEVLDGTGSSRLYLAYPISVLTSVKLGYDSTSPDETLAVANKAVLVYGAGSRIITRTDGGRFGTVRQPRYVQVVYDAMAALPADAKLAIMSVVAGVYRSRSADDFKSETFGAFYSYTKADVAAAADADPFWKMAVEANTPVVLA